MRYFLDTEFIEDGKTIELLSIGIVCEDGREFYQVTQLGFDELQTPTLSNDWVRENVLPHLLDGPGRDLQTAVNQQSLRMLVEEFCDPETNGKPEFWGYYADYDWVVFCQLFGRMIDLPKGFPMYCRDIKQWADDLGSPRLPEQSTTEHHALADAQWNKGAWEFLRQVRNDNERATP